MAKTQKFLTTLGMVSLILLATIVLWLNNYYRQQLLGFQQQLNANGPGRLNGANDYCGFSPAFGAEMRRLRRDFNQANGPQKDRIADQAIQTAFNYHCQKKRQPQYHQYLCDAMASNLIQWPALCRVDPTTAQAVKTRMIDLCQQTVKKFDRKPPVDPRSGYAIFKQIITLQAKGIFTWEELGTNQDKLRQLMQPGRQQAGQEIKK
ncbi:MAG: hypothetical protein WC668_00865 [Patescibacteria group bacterium]